MLLYSVYHVFYRFPAIASRSISYVDNMHHLTLSVIGTAKLVQNTRSVEFVRLQDNIHLLTSVQGRRVASVVVSLVGKVKESRQLVVFVHAKVFDPGKNVYATFHLLQHDLGASLDLTGGSAREAKRNVWDE